MSAYSRGVFYLLYFRFIYYIKISHSVVTSVCCRHSLSFTNNMQTLFAFLKPFRDTICPSCLR